MTKDCGNATMNAKEVIDWCSENISKMTYKCTLGNGTRYDGKNWSAYIDSGGRINVWSDTDEKVEVFLRLKFGGNQF